MTNPYAALVLAPSVGDPDADLIRICAEHIVNWDAYNRYGGHLEPAVDPLWLAYERTLDFISEARPETLAGLAAKARAAKIEALIDERGTKEDLEFTGMHGQWAWDLVNDLVRLQGGRA